MLLWEIDDYGFLQKKIWKCYTYSKNIPFKFYPASLQSIVITSWPDFKKLF